MYHKKLFKIVILTVGISMPAWIMYLNSSMTETKATKKLKTATFTEEQRLRLKSLWRTESPIQNIAENRAEERLRKLRENMLESCRRLGLNESLSGEEVYKRNPYLEKSLFFSDKQKVLFCLIPKCATRSQAAFLASAEGLLPDGDSKSSGYNLVEGLTPRKSTLKENGRRIEEYTKVAIAREPFSRLLSAFRDKIENGGRGDYYKAVYRAVKGNKTQQDVTFEQFISYLTKSKDVQTDPHWNYYHRLCAPCEMNYDYIIHMDTVEEDIGFFAKRLGIANFSFPPSFNSFTDYEKVVHYYAKVSPQLVNDLYHRYRKDYEIFGFPPPPQF